MPASEELPSTLERSDKHAQALWSKAHDSAVEEYGEGERAHRTAFSALKHEYEKVGDHWERKAENGPSDRKAAGGRDTMRPPRRVSTRTPPKRICSTSPSGSTSPAARRMTKDELVDEIKRANRRETAAKRKKS